MRHRYVYQVSTYIYACKNKNICVDYYWKKYLNWKGNFVFIKICTFSFCLRNVLEPCSLAHIMSKDTNYKMNLLRINMWCKSLNRIPYKVEYLWNRITVSYTIYLFLCKACTNYSDIVKMEYDFRSFWQPLFIYLFSRFLL